MLRQRRSVPIMSTVAALLRSRGPRWFAASGTVVEQYLVSRVSKDSGCCRELEPLIAVSSEAQHVRFKQPTCFWKDEQKYGSHGSSLFEKYANLPDLQQI